MEPTGTGPHLKDTNPAIEIVPNPKSSNINFINGS